MADAYSRKAERLRREATEMRQVASRLARRSSQRTDRSPERWRDVPGLKSEVDDVTMTTDVASTEEARTLDREVEKSQALYARLVDTEAKIKAAKERTEELTEALAKAELAAAGRSSPEAERLRRELSKVATEVAVKA